MINEANCHPHHAPNYLIQTVEPIRPLVFFGIFSLKMFNFAIAIFLRMSLILSDADGPLFEVTHGEDLSLSICTSRFSRFQ